MASGPEPVEFGVARGRPGCGVAFPVVLILIGIGLLVVAFRTRLDLGFGVVPIFFGGVLLWVASAPRRAGDMGLRLDADGIHLRNPLKGYDFDLRWPEVVGVRPERFRGQPLVALDGRDPKPDLLDADELGRERRRKSLAEVGSGYVVPTSLYGTTPEALVEAIERFRAAYGAPLSPPEDGGRRG